MMFLIGAWSWTMSAIYQFLENIDTVVSIFFILCFQRLVTSKWFYLKQRFLIFPSAVQLGNMSKILTNNCDRETLKYIPKRELWINRLHFGIANKKDYSCLNTDCGKSGPAKYRPEAGNNVRQTCFFSQKKKDMVSDRFTSHNLEPHNSDSLIFKIELTDKNSIKERHLPYNQLLSKGNGNIQVNDDNRSNDRRNFKGKSAENEPDVKRCCDRDGAKTRKRPRFLVS